MSEDAVTINVLLFGSVKDAVNKEVPVKVKLNKFWSNQMILKEFLCTQVFPSLNQFMPSLILAINTFYLIDNQDEIELKDNDEVAIIPPITGG